MLTHQDINASIGIRRVTPGDLDRLLAQGWRHFGSFFFRYSANIHEGLACQVRPLRVRVAEFAPTKSQRRVLRRNADLSYRVQRVTIDETKHTLFEKHTTRFRGNVPDSITNFLGEDPAHIPGYMLEFAVFDEARLVAVSFLDIGVKSVSSVYAMFDPEYERRSLGIYTALLELEFAKQMNFSLYYLGYSYDVSSPYDYKKRFPALEVYDWRGSWIPEPRLKDG